MAVTEEQRQHEPDDLRKLHQRLACAGDDLEQCLPYISKYRDNKKIKNKLRKILKLIPMIMLEEE